MQTIMKLEDVTTVVQLTDFLSGTQAVAFTVLSDKDACYRWIQGELVKFQPLMRARRDKGVVIRYLMKVSGYSRQQITRLIRQYRQDRHTQAPPAHGGRVYSQIHGRGYPLAGGDG